MAKKKWKYTEEELAIHEKAVKLRKMTDVQLVEAFKGAQQAVMAPHVAQDSENGQNSKNDTSDVEKLLQALSDGKCKGVAGATCYKIMEFAKGMGLIA